MTDSRGLGFRCAALGTAQGEFALLRNYSYTAGGAVIGFLGGCDEPEAGADASSREVP